MHFVIRSERAQKKLCSIKRKDRKMKAVKIALVIGVAAVCTLPVAAGSHHGRHHHGNDGVRLAANIVVGLVKNALQIQQPVVVTAPAVVVTPPPVVHCPPPRRHNRPLPPPPPRKGHHHRGHGRR